MHRYISIALLVGMAAATAAGEDVVFHKSTIFDSHGKEHKVDLMFMGENKAMVVREKITIVANIPFGAIDKVAYSYSQRHRVKEGAEVIGDAAKDSVTPLGLVTLPVGLLFGSGAMLTKEKKHWL